MNGRGRHYLVDDSTGMELAEEHVLGCFLICVWLAGSGCGGHLVLGSCPGCACYVLFGKLQLFALPYLPLCF